jgi:hypothetical protein
MDGWSGWGAELSDGDGDGIFAGSMVLNASDIAYEYKYTCGGWDQVEDVPDECAFNTEWHNRGFYLTDGDLTLDSHPWSGCPGDGPPPSGPEFSVSLNASSTTGSYDLVAGFSSSATDGFDPNIDDYAPPSPPPPAFDAALGWDGDRYFIQMLGSSESDFGEAHVFDVLLQYDESGTVDLAWDNTGWNDLGTFTLVDAFGGDLVSVNMNEDSGVSLDNPALTMLHFSVTPGTYEPPPPAGPNVFFSEYAEGSSNNKYLEIYNGTDGAVSLADFVILGNYNGNPFSEAFVFSGSTLESGDVYVIANSSASDAILALADEALSYGDPWYTAGFNGDDVRALAHVSGGDTTILDIIGTLDGGDPGSGWPVAGVDNATKDNTLVRKDEVSSGNGGDWASSAGTNADDSEWIVSERPTADYTPPTLGWHINAPPPSPVNVTFQLNMAYQDPSDGVYIRGGNIGSSLPDIPSMGFQMSDDDGDLVYAVTLELDANAHYTYKFATGESWNWEGNWENVPAECGEGEYTDRFMDTGDSDMTLDPVCFGSCEDCAEETVILTFNLDMSGVETSSEGVFVGGGGTFGVPGENPMSDDDGDDVWTATFELPAGLSTDYTFLNGNCGDWSCKENIAGQDCAVPPYSDRHIDLGSDDVTVNACFAVCGDGSCSDLTLPETINVTFQVNMNGYDWGTYDPTTSLHATGNYEGWTGAGTLLSDSDADGIYSAVVEIIENTTGVEYKYVIGGWGGPESGAELGSDCDYNPSDEYNNYGFDVATDDIVLPAYIFGGGCSVSEEPPSPVQVTFQVDMSHNPEVLDGHTIALQGEFAGGGPEL